MLDAKDDEGAMGDSGMDGSVTNAPLSAEGWRFTWFSALSKLLVVGAALASAGAVSLHLTGYAAQRSFLRAFNVDPDGFPRSTDWMLVNGYYSVIDVGLLLLRNLVSWPSLMVFCYLMIIMVIYRWEPKKRGVPPLLARLKSTKGFQLWGLSLLYSSLTFFVLYFTLPVAMLIMLAPGLAGETFGENQAKKLILEYSKGCTAENPCSEAWKGGERIALGYVIATSEERIAFYDVDARMVRLIETAGFELRSPLNPKFVGNGICGAKGVSAACKAGADPATGKGTHTAQ